MFKIKAVRFAALVLVVTGAAVFVSCREQGEPTPGALPSTDNPDYYVDGYCYDTSSSLTDGITRKIYCETCEEWIYTEHVSGTLAHGYYKCVPTPPEYSPHRYHRVHAVGEDGGDYWGKSISDEMDDGGLHLNIYEGQ